MHCMNDLEPYELDSIEDAKKITKHVNTITEPCTNNFIIHTAAREKK